jgi:hypothetical protein
MGRIKGQPGYKADPIGKIQKAKKCLPNTHEVLNLNSNLPPQKMYLQKETSSFQRQSPEFLPGLDFNDSFLLKKNKAGSHKVWLQKPSHQRELWVPFSGSHS